MEIINFLPLLVWSLIIATPWQNYETESDGESFAKIYFFGLLFWWVTGLLCGLKIW
jgi:hypothetical protein